MSDSIHGESPGTALACMKRVFIPTRNRKQTLGACIQSLRIQSYPCRAMVEDSSTPDDTVTIAEHGAEVRLCASRKRSAQRSDGVPAFPNASLICNRPLCIRPPQDRGPLIGVISPC